jgi:peptidoglycan/LPS O-acetylase OafA/YrhL
MRRNLELDRLRAFAVMMTVYAHLDFLVGFTENWYRKTLIYINGSDGVILFFAISGYIISCGLVPLLDKAIDTKKVLSEFWIKRATRILPMAVLWLLIPLCMAVAANSHYLIYDIHGAIAALLNVYNIFAIFDQGKSQFGIYWSLSLEEQFYLAFPFFLIVIRNWRTRIFALICFSLLLNILPASIRPSFRCEAIIYGVMLFLLLQKYKPLLTFNANQNFKNIVSLILLFFIIAIPPALSQRMPACLYYPLTPLISILLVFLATQEKEFIFSYRKINTILDWIGTRSYGIYLIHISVFQVARYFVTSLLIRGIVATILIIIVAEICYKYFETPIRIWGKKLANNKNPLKSGSPYKSVIY